MVRQVSSNSTLYVQVYHLADCAAYINLHCVCQRHLIICLVELETYCCRITAPPRTSVPLFPAPEHMLRHPPPASCSCEPHLADCLVELVVLLIRNVRSLAQPDSLQQQQQQPMSRPYQTQWCCFVDAVQLDPPSDDNTSTIDASGNRLCTCHTKQPRLPLAFPITTTVGRSMTLWGLPNSDTPPPKRDTHLVVIEV